MSYYREARIDEVITWLNDNFGLNGRVEVDSDVLAQALRDKFDILWTSSTPT